MSLSKFESMLKTNDVYFFDATEFEHIIQHYLEIGKHSLARKAVQLGTEQHPTSITLKLLQVELLIFEDKLKEAVVLLSQIEDVEPNNEEVFIQKANILSKNGKHREAIEKLKASLNFVEDPVDVWSMIGMEYLYLDDYENAQLNFAKCIDVDYEDYSSLYNIIYCFEMQQNHESAIKYLNTYIERNPYCEVAWHQLGRQYFTLNMFKEALVSFDYAVLIDDSFIGGYLEKAKTLEQLEQFEEAIENYLITLELDDPTAYAYVRIGECFEKLNSLESALKYYKKAVHEDPLLDRGWILLTDIYFEKKDYQKALYYIGKALQIDESSSVYWRKYADINIKLAVYEEAITALNNCINLGDEAIEVYTTLADVLLVVGDTNAALKTIISAKKIYKEFAEIEYRLCGLFMMLDKEDYSLLHLKNALVIDFEYRSVVKGLFPSVFENQKIQEVIKSHKKAVS